MHEQNTSEQQTDGRWYVLWHLNPRLLETMLQKDLRGDFLHNGQQPLAPYRYYMPYQYMPHIPADKVDNDRFSDRHYDALSDKNALRDDLHNFVLVQAPFERVQELVSSDWNRAARLRLNWYRDTTGHEVSIPDSEVQLFIKTIEDSHLHFFFDQPLDEFAVGDQVILQMAPWTGRQGEVRKVQIKGDSTRITVSLNILGRIKSICFPDLHVGDVRFVDAEKGRLLSGNPIDNYQEEIFDILNNRFNKTITDEIVENDQLRLKRLSTYTNIYVADDVERQRFLGLKLLCAYLRNERSRVTTLTDELLASAQIENQPVQQVTRDAKLSTLHSLQERSETVSNPSPLTPNLSPLTSHLENAHAFSILVLFVVTRDVTLRTKAKSFIQSHPDCPPPLRRFLSIVKNIKAKKM